MRLPSPLFERGASAIPPLPLVRTGAGAAAPYECALEATSGFEPLIEVLQTSALPLGHVALTTICYAGAEDEIRTRDPLLGKEMLYH